jgi:2-desacetyl-2-hydroxyethyl bacteriochlorophyllide A dehydrogenase
VKAALFNGTPGLNIVDTSRPECCERYALVKIRYSSLCGSDLYIVSGKNPRTPAPLIPGHEFAGRIEELPDNHSSSFQVGDRVTALISIHCGTCIQCRLGNSQHCENLKILGCQTNGSFAEYTKIPIENLISLPDTITDEDAVLIEPTSIAVHALSAAKPRLGSTALIIGGGAIGYLIAQAARQAGCTTIIVLDISEERLENIRSAGFIGLNSTDQKETTNTVIDIVGSNGLDYVFECAGLSSSFELFMTLGSPKSTMTIVGNYKSATSVDFFRLARKEQKIITSWLSTLQDYYAAIELIRKGVIDHKMLHCHFLPLTEVSTGLHIAENPGRALRVVFTVGN